MLRVNKSNLEPIFPDKEFVKTIVDLILRLEEVYSHTNGEKMKDELLKTIGLLNKTLELILEPRLILREDV